MSFKIHYLDVKNALRNYIWLIEHTPSQEVMVIDPTEAQLVQNYCAENHLKIKQIWLTHWHKDHVGGVPELTQNQEIMIYGSQRDAEKITFINRPLNHQDRFFFHELEIEIIAVPGHTLGHIVYFISELNALFCGDTLFAMGCGRVFEGTFEQMFHSLQKLAQLPKQTKVYCTHEYTWSNAQFARHVEPNNAAIQQRYQQIAEMEKNRQITLPSTLEIELATNPFLRVNNVLDFQKLRLLKDQF